jgi:hypothetical protein
MGKDVIGKIRPVHDLRLLMAKTKDFPDKRCIVMLTPTADGGSALPDLAADG